MQLHDKQDIVICLVSGVEGRSREWLAAETSRAQGQNKPIILMEEDGLQFNATLLGQDRERIRFPKNELEKTFIPLLHEFRRIGVKSI